ncbi:hypothetical protein BJV82DRAFT_592307 [Fennellomyces sp. T-0311]|nr:hypothetical protein BJV82DRAFT_592307 [Fennellomyces sp. T-0311]
MTAHYSRSIYHTQQSADASSCAKDTGVSWSPRKKVVALRLGSGMSIRIAPFAEGILRKDANERSVAPWKKFSSREIPSDDGSAQLAETSDDEAEFVTDQKKERVATGKRPGDQERRTVRFKRGRKSGKPLSSTWYCPYQGCGSLEFRSRSRIFSHIRNRHDAQFPKFHPNRSCSFHAESGKVVTFDNKASRNSLSGDEKISVLTVTGALLPDPKFYCPYKGCMSVQKRLPGLYHHIRAFHCPSMAAVTKKRGSPKFMAPNGKIYCFANESCRGKLTDGDSINVLKFA